MATTEKFYTGNNSTTTFGFPFPILQNSDLIVELNGVEKTENTSGTNNDYSISNTNVVFNSAPGQDIDIHIYRRTNVDSPKAVFAAGSAIRAGDLNNIIDQSLYANQEQQQKIRTADVRDHSITSAKIQDGTIVNADINASANIDNSKIADGLLKSGITVNSANIVNGTIVDADINSSANIQGSKLLNDSVPLTKLGGGTLPSDIDISSTNIQDGTITNIDISNSAAIAHSKLALNIVDSDINSSADIAGSKLANDSVGLSKLGGGALPTDITVSSNNIVDGTIVNADIKSDAGILYTKLQTGVLPADRMVNSANIVDNSIVDGDINSSANIQGSKLANDSVPLTKFGSGALPTDITVASANIVDGTIVDADINNNADIQGSKLLNNSVSLDKLGGGNLPTDINVSDSNIVTGTLDNRYYTETELDAGQLDTRYFTETELTGGALDGRYYTETEAEALFLRQDSSETIASGVAWSNTDGKVATTAAINARIIDLIDEVGGFTAIANQTSFPATNPQGATGQSAILSIQATSATLTPSGTTVTIPNGAGTGNTVTITGVPTAIPQNFGFLVESTATLHTYSFHRLVPIATQVNTVAQNITNIVQAGINVADINNFADIYIISSSEPTARNDSSALQEGDLWFDTSNDNLLVYTGSAFAIITPSQSVLDDVAIVSGAITYSEDLGLITNPVSTGTSNGSLDIVADALEDEITFTVTASGGKFLIDGVSAPALTLYKGWTYTFDVSDSSNGSHPLRFYANSSQYSTGVVVIGTQGSAGAKVQIKIPESQLPNFQYYCTNHSGMGSTITVKDDPIKTVSDNVVKIIAAADNSANVNAVQANESNINAVNANASNINAAVANASNINAAVANATDISAVAANNSNITDVANNNTNITAVKNNEVNINAVKNNATNINAVAANNSNITAVANNETNINAVKNNSANINIVSGNNVNVSTVAANNTNVTTVAGKATEIGRLGTADAVADMNTLGTTAIVSDMDTLADISSNITTVAGISSNVTTVAGISSNVTTVANNSANVTAVAGNSTNINSAVSNASNINAAVSNASNINSVVSNATNINTVATNVTDVNTFANRYRIGSTNPTNSLDTGDLFFNTSANELRVYNGSTWQGGVTATGNFATTAGVIFTGDNRYNDNVKAKYGNDSDLQIFHNTTDSIIDAAGVGNIKLQDSGNTKLEVTSSGISVTGDLGVSGTVDGVDIAARNTLFGGLTSSSGVLTNGVTATTQAQSDNSTKISTTAYVRTAVSDLVNSSPSSLDTLKELSDALGADANFSTTVTNSIATKAPINNPTFTGTVTAGTIDGTNLTLDFGTL